MSTAELTVLAATDYHEMAGVLRIMPVIKPMDRDEAKKHRDGAHRLDRARAAELFDPVPQFTNWTSEFDGLDTVKAIERELNRR